MKDENHITILIDTEKLSEKIRFMIKILNKLGVERNFLDLIREDRLILEDYALLLM